MLFDIDVTASAASIVLITIEEFVAVIIRFTVMKAIEILQCKIGDVLGECANWLINVIIFHAEIARNFATTLQWEIEFAV